MRKEHDSARGTPLSHRRGRLRSSPPADQDVDPLTPAQIRELDRRVRDSDDRTRYVLAGPMSRRFTLYYNVSEDCYGMNEPMYATLFKRRRAAETIKSQLNGAVQVVRCRVDKRGRLIPSSLPKLRPLRLVRQKRAV